MLRSENFKQIKLDFTTNSPKENRLYPPVLFFVLKNTRKRADKKNIFEIFSYEKRKMRKKIVLYY